MTKNLDQICVKCGKKRYKAKNIPIGTLNAIESEDIFAVKYVKYCKDNGKTVSFFENLRVTCSRCGYSWNEPCVDRGHAAKLLEVQNCD